MPSVATLVRSKLDRAAVPRFAVRRDGPLGVLADGWSRHRLTVLTAPAGHGKSTLVSQFVETIPDVPVAWIAIDERDADPVRLSHHLAAALEAIVPGLVDRASPAIGA